VGSRVVAPRNAPPAVVFSPHGQRHPREEAAGAVHGRADWIDADPPQDARDPKLPSMTIEHDG
jgi:hypothetical protein